MTYDPGLEVPKRPRKSRATAPVAILAFVVGVAAWGVLFTWALGEARGLLDDDGDAGGDVIVEPGGLPDCDSLGLDGARTPEEEAAFAEECTTPTPPPATPTSTPQTPTATPTLAPTDENRFNCQLIRGTDYLSPDERSWFLENCLTPTP